MFGVLSLQASIFIKIQYQKRVFLLIFCCDVFQIMNKDVFFFWICYFALDDFICLCYIWNLVFYICWFEVFMCLDSLKTCVRIFMSDHVIRWNLYYIYYVHLFSVFICLTSLKGSAYLGSVVMFVDHWYMLCYPFLLIILDHNDLNNLILFCI